MPKKSTRHLRTKALHRFSDQTHGLEGEIKTIYVNKKRKKRNRARESEKEKNPRKFT